MGNVGTFVSAPLISATLGAGIAGPALMTAALSAAGIVAIKAIGRRVRPAV